MTAKTLVKMSKNAWFAIVASVAIVTLAFVSFIMAEPQIGHSQDTTQDFYVRQTITGESTFLVNPTDVTMDGPISGITGGNATGTSQFVVQSNSATGYYVNIDFFDNAGSYSMYGDSTGSEDIYDYGIGNAEPTFGFTPEASATFSYTVSASSSGDIDQSFQNDGGACNAGSNTTADVCWARPSTTEFTIIDSNSSAPTGATSTVKFKVNVPSGATPTPAAETYTATATLSLYTQ